MAKYGRKQLPLLPYPVAATTKDDAGGGTVPVR